MDFKAAATDFIPQKSYGAGFRVREVVVFVTTHYYFLAYLSPFPHIRIHLECLASVTELNVWLDLPVSDVGTVADWKTPSLMNKSSHLFLRVHRTHLYFSHSRHSAVSLPVYLCFASIFLHLLPLGCRLTMVVFNRRESDLSIWSSTFKSCSICIYNRPQ